MVENDDAPQFVKPFHPTVIMENIVRRGVGMPANDDDSTETSSQEEQVMRRHHGHHVVHQEEGFNPHDDIPDEGPMAGYVRWSGLSPLSSKLWQDWLYHLAQ